MNCRQTEDISSRRDVEVTRGESIHRRAGSLREALKNANIQGHGEEEELSEKERKFKVTSRQLEGNRFYAAMRAKRETL